MAARYDAIIVGAGHNGLTCGAYLARAGLKVLVLERRGVIGGAAVTEEVVPGFKFSVFSYLMSLLHPKVIADLDLRRHGFEVLPASDMFSPLPNGDHLVFSDNIATTQANFARFSTKDAAIYPEFDRYLMEAANIVRRLLLETPPDPSCPDRRSFCVAPPASCGNTARVGGKLFRLIDLMTMSADDYLSEWFENTARQGGAGLLLRHRHVRRPAHAGLRLCHHAPCHGRTRRRRRLGFRPRRHGNDHPGDRRFGPREGHGDPAPRPKSPRSIRDGGRATGVTLADGSRAHGADRRQQCLSAKLTFLKFLAGNCLPAAFVRDLEAYRTFSTAFKINIACERLPALYQLRCRRHAVLPIRPTPISDPRSNISSARTTMPNMAIFRATVHHPGDAELCRRHRRAAGKTRRASVRRPRALHADDGDWDSRQGRIHRNVLDVMDEHAPGFSSGIIGMQVLTPPDIEAKIGSPHGHIFHGELQIDQLFWARPAPHWADYRSPIKGLYQCGSSAHPGGGVGGVAGHNAAREILRDRRR